MVKYNKCQFFLLILFSTTTPVVYSQKGTAQLHYVISILQPASHTYEVEPAAELAYSCWQGKDLPWTRQKIWRGEEAPVDHALSDDK
jgi:hypothetical protein